MSWELTLTIMRVWSFVFLNIMIISIAFAIDDGNNDE
jgi:hypothetical protein